MPAPRMPGARMPGLTAPDAALRRWALAALVGLTVLLVAVGGLLMTALPFGMVAVALVPLVLVGLVAAGLYPDAGLVGLLVMTAALFQPDEGMSPDEVAYLVLYLVVLAAWYGSRLVTGRPIVRTRLDAVALFVSVVGVAGGIALGVLNGASPLGIRGEATGFSTLALFLPVREFVRSNRRGPVIIGGILVFFGMWISIRNALTAYTAIAEATQLWQIADVRTANGDLTLHIGTVVAFSAATTLRGRWLKLACAAAGSVCLIGVFLAKSRGYWVAFVFALVLTFLFSSHEARRRLVLGGAATVVAIIGPGLLLLGPTALVLYAGAVRRITSIGSSLTTDVSLVNRFYETRAAWAKITESPVLGHGFGTQFTYHSVLMDSQSTASFVHNGFVGVWLKLGLWGLVTVVVLWAGSGISGVWASRYAPNLSRIERGLAVGSGVAVLSLLPTVTTSNPFLLFDTLIVVVVAMGLAHGLAQRGRLATPPAGAAASAEPAEAL